MALIGMGIAVFATQADPSKPVSFLGNPSVQYAFEMFCG